jgi:hypothetical protein
MFTNATVNSMSQQSPGFAFANNMMNDPQGPSRNMGPPPAPVETKNIPPPPRPGQMNFTERPINNPNANRPDINMGRGTMAQERMENTNNNYDRSVNVPAPTTLPREFQRPEMRGPQTDIDNILSGLKTKTIDIHEDNGGDDSMISISSLKDMQGSSIPKKSNRRRNNGSNKNTISLDI